MNKLFFIDFINYDLEDKIILLGKKNNPYPYVKASDCYILSSRHESFGLVVLEALILKVPVLATRVASIKEIMDDDFGFIVDNNDEDLYNGILKIIDKNPYTAFVYLPSFAVSILLPIIP